MSLLPPRRSGQVLFLCTEIAISTVSPRRRNCWSKAGSEEPTRRAWSGTAAARRCDPARGARECADAVRTRWLDEGRLRDRARVFTKGGHHVEEGIHRIAPDQITHDLLESLDELKTDRVALYMLHRDGVSSPVGPIIECLHAHSEAGRIDAYGGSNWSTARLDTANAYAASRYRLRR
ncbi:MAG: hypothetical protein EPO26_14985 [Chloroflexota bacterium]|nr:MAG: hypothetical protein EPO26_14985 [Chloroflexota bacterium]